MPLHPPNFPSERPISIAEITDLANELPLKPPNPDYNWRLRQTLAAQLWFYGVITYQMWRKPPLPSLKKRTREAIQAGKFVENPPRVQQYRDAVRQRDEAIRSLNTLEERAKYDADLFIHLYFCTDGKPDRSKTPQPIILREFTGDDWKLYWASTGVYGLKFKSVDHSNGMHLRFKSVFLGWDHAAIQRLSEDAIAQERAKTPESLRNTAMEKHKKLIASVKPVDTSTNALDLISRCFGSYFIDYVCKELACKLDDSWPLIDIQQSVPTATILVAEAGFGPIEGTMLLSFSEEGLDSYIAANDRKKFVHKSENDNADDDQGNKKGEDEGESGYSSFTKESNKRKASAAATKHSQPTKKVKSNNGESFTPRRLHCRFKGIKYGGPNFDLEKGYFDFDPTFTSFKGILNLSKLGTAVTMEGSKTDKKPRLSVHIAVWGSEFVLRASKNKSVWLKGDKLIGA